MANAGDGLRVYDVSDQTNPVDIGHSATNYGAPALDVAVAGNYAYVANFSDGLRVFDISNPAVPTNVGHVTHWNSSTNNLAEARGVTVAGNYLYLANYNDGLRVYDVSDPTNPTTLAHTPTNHGGLARYATVSSNYVYLANDGDGLRVYLLVPQLSIALTSTNTVLVSWSVPPVNEFRLQRASDLAVADWEAVTNRPTIINNRNQVILSPFGGRQLFRLNRP